MNIGELKHRIEIWGNLKAVNELGEDDISPSKIKTVWASITPLTGVIQNGEPNTKVAKTTHKIKIRVKSYPELRDDNWIMYKGVRYDIKYFQPDFKNSQFTEIFTEVITE